MAEDHFVLISILPLEPDTYKDNAYTSPQPLPQHQGLLWALTSTKVFKVYCPIPNSSHNSHEGPH